ncbi:hypothetical protein N0V84_006836 [Fusarium piperis]|uniref:Uncharacterized protein n=1 Tax=Fusarium piperis TaxID=1435070 RepID=A0A9W8WB60_9HYPO|nr:hypothetical protein N0V84_006836 [Fusarium piperis]
MTTATLEDAVKRPTSSHAEGTTSAYQRMPESLLHLSEAEVAAMNKKLNLAAAKLQDTTEDLNMTTEQFATSISILFAGYLPFQIPSNLIISSIARPGLYICCAVVIWGSISACTAAVKTYGQLLAVRAIPGVSGAVFFPGAIYYISACLYVAQQVGNAFGGLFAAGIFQLDGIMESAAGSGSSSSKAPPLLELLERDLAVWRVESDAGAAEGTEKESTLKGFTKALSDPKLLLLILCNMLSQAQGSIANYFPTLVASLNFNRTVSLLQSLHPP